MAAHQETLDAPLDRTRAALARPWLVGLATAALTFWLAFEKGSYDLPMRYALGVGVWWAVVVAVVARLARSNQAAALTAGALAAFALWTLASTTWAADAESAFAEFNRVSLYTGVFVLCSLLVRRRDVGCWCDGLGFGIAAVAALSFGSRAFPGTIGDNA